VVRVSRLAELSRDAAEEEEEEEEEEVACYGLLGT
jgi:hypothetical protein